MAASIRPSISSLPPSPSALPQSAPPSDLLSFPRLQPSAGRPPRSRRPSAAGASPGPSAGPSRSRGGSLAAANVRSGRALAAANARSGRAVPSLSTIQSPTGAVEDPTLLSGPSHAAAAHGEAPSAPLSGVREVVQEAKLSYANIVRDPSGPSFIREHSIAVAEFGVLPDIVADPRISSIGGEPSVHFSPEELRAAENIFADAVVMKFLSARPTWEACYAAINSWGLKQQFIMGPLDSRSILLRFRDHSDMIAVLARGSNYINGFPYRAFRWNRLYNIKEDAAFAPVWVSFPRLPIPFYVPSMLRGIAKSIGNFLCFDRPTTLMTRASSARVCIEVDLRKKLPAHVWIGVHGKFKQPIIYERLPKFCNFCKMQGHAVEECKKVPVDKSNPINHGVYEPLVHNGNASAMATHSNSTFVASPSNQNGGLTISELNPSPTPAPLMTSDVQRPSQVQQIPGDQQGGRHVVVGHTVQPAASLPLQQDSLTRLQSQPNRDMSDPRQVCMTDSANQHPLKSHPAMPLADSGPCIPTVCQNDAVLNSVPAVGPGQYNAIVSASDASTVCRTDSLNQPLPQSSPTLLDPAAAGCTPSACQNAEGTIHAANDQNKASNLITVPNQMNLVEGQQPESINQDPNLVTKPIQPKPLDGGHGLSLTQQQAVALERFKNKVKAQTITKGQQLIGSTSANPFEALFDDHSDENDFDNSAASYYSDTDDGVEPINMGGYQSADGRSSHHITAPSAMKTNKRHPNIPLNVRLRARKGSHPSSP